MQETREAIILYESPAHLDQCNYQEGLFFLFSLPFLGGGGGWKVRKSGMQERKDLFFQKCKLKAEILWLVQTDCCGTGQGRKIILKVLTLFGCLYIPVTHSDLISSETTVPFCRHLEPRC